MLFIPTILIGNLFGNVFAPNVFLAFILGFISYYLINIIPHWTPENYKNRYVLIVRFADFVIGTIYFLFLLFFILNPDVSTIFTNNGKEIIFDIRSFAGALGAIIPFLFKYFGKIRSYKNVFLKKIYIFTTKFSYHDRSFWGIFVQIAITIVAITIIFQLIDFPSWQKIVFQLSR